MSKGLYALREPKDDKAWNMYALKEASKLKNWFLGTYYNDELKRLLVVFDPPPKTYINESVFEDLPGGTIKESYLMECPEGCGRCCAFQSNTFILSNELKYLPEKIQAKIRLQPLEEVNTPTGALKSYRLGTGILGMCIFFNPSTIKCALEEIGGKAAKPIICLITYCTIFATKGGSFFLKVGYKELNDRKVAMFYRQVTREEWRRALAKMASISARHRRSKEGPRSS